MSCPVVVRVVLEIYQYRRRNLGFGQELSGKINIRLDAVQRLERLHGTRHRFRHHRIDRGVDTLVHVTRQGFAVHQRRDRPTDGQLLRIRDTRHRLEVEDDVPEPAGALMHGQARVDPQRFDIVRRQAPICDVDGPVLNIDLEIFTTGVVLDADQIPLRLAQAPTYFGLARRPIS